MFIPSYRTFISFDIVPNFIIRDAVDDIIFSLKSYKINWVDNYKYHITLAFLGDTKLPIISEICYQLKQIALQTNSIEIEVANFGVFPNLKSPKVLWLGLNYSSELNILQKKISDLIYKLGFSLDTKPFSPHLTIGRIKEIENSLEIEKLIKKYNKVTFTTQKIDKIILYKSTLHPGGSIYEPIEKFDLKK